MIPPNAQAVDKLLDELRSVLGAERVATSDEVLTPYALDPSPETPSWPAAVVWPRSTADVVRVVRASRKAGVPVTPRAAGLNLSGLAVARFQGLIADLSRMDAIVKVDADDLVAIVEPGVTFAQLEAAIKDRGLPVTLGAPAGPPGTSVVAACILGAETSLSLQRGPLSHSLVAAEVVLPTGEVVRLGSPAMVGGWFGDHALPDLVGLLSGFQGTTGIIVRAAIRLWPAQNQHLKLAVVCEDFTVAMPVLRRLARSGFVSDLAAVTGRFPSVAPPPRPGLPPPSEGGMLMIAAEVVGAEPAEVAWCRDRLEHLVGEPVLTGVEGPVDAADLLRDHPDLSPIFSSPVGIPGVSEAPQSGFLRLGARGPWSTWEAAATRGAVIMDRHGLIPQVSIRPINAGHVATLTFLAPFEQGNAREIGRVRRAAREIIEMCLHLGLVPHPVPAWAAPIIFGRIDPGFAELLRRLRRAMDPGRYLNRGLWEP